MPNIFKEKQLLFYCLILNDIVLMHLQLCVCVMCRTGRGVREVLVDHWKNFELSNGSFLSLFLITTRICKLSRCAAG